MTDKTRQDSGSTHIIRYALELGLLWVDGDGRDKVREALDALDALEAQLEAIGAGGVQALSAAPEAIAKLRHLYQNMVNGAVRDTASAKRIAEGLLAPAIEALERATPPAEQQAAPKAAPGEWTPTDAQIIAACRAYHGWSDATPRSGAEAANWRLALEAAYRAALGEREQAAQRLRELAGIPQNDVTDPFHPRYIEGYKAGHAAGRKRAAPKQEAQEPCPTCAALARTVMLDQVSFDRKPDCYGIRQITDDEGVEEWEDIRTSPDVAREEANDMMATGRGEIYEVVPLWTTPQPAPAPLSDDTERLEWLLWKLPGDALRYVVGELADTSSGSEFRAAIDAALAAQGEKT